MLEMDRGGWEDYTGIEEQWDYFLQTSSKSWTRASVQSQELRAHCRVASRASPAQVQQNRKASLGNHSKHILHPVRKMPIPSLEDLLPHRAGKTAFCRIARRCHRGKTATSKTLSICLQGKKTTCKALFKLPRDKIATCTTNMNRHRGTVLGMGPEHPHQHLWPILFRGSHLQLRTIQMACLHRLHRLLIERFTIKDPRELHPPSQ